MNISSIVLFYIFITSSSVTINILFLVLAISTNSSASFTSRGCLIFNDSAASDQSVCAIDFGGDKTVTSGTFTIEFPAATAGNAIIGIA